MRTFASSANTTMSTVQEIKQAVRKLPLSKRLKVVKWVAVFDNDEWARRWQKTPPTASLISWCVKEKKRSKKAVFDRFLVLDLKNHAAILERVSRVASKHPAAG
jgi:hypothetical protein